MTPNRVTEIEEVVEEFENKFIDVQSEEVGSTWQGAPDDVPEFLRTKLSTLIAEAEARGRQQAVEYIRENLMYGRMDGDNIVVHAADYDGLLTQALTNHTV